MAVNVHFLILCLKIHYLIRSAYKGNLAIDNLYKSEHTHALL